MVSNYHCADSSVLVNGLRAGKATKERRKDFLRRREGQTAHYGLRKVLRCAARKTTLDSRGT